MRIFRIVVKALIGLITVLVLIMLINFIPTIRLGHAKMSVFVGDWVNVYYETDREAARDTFELAEERAEELAELLGLKEKQNIRIYIYDSQKTMQRKKYGFIASFLKLDWYIGDNVGTDVILTSPANPGKQHTYDSVKDAVLHEIVHAYNHVLNKNMTYWVDNGLAGYLSGQNPGDIKNYGTVPTLEQTRVKGLTGPIKFAKFNGYAFSYNYIEYLNITFSWDRVKEFAGTGDYEAAFGMNEEEIYNEWVRSMED